MQTAPADNSTQTGTQVTFSWQDYRTTNAGVTYTGGAAPSHQSGLRYRIQVSQSATIQDGNAIDDVTVDQTTYTAYDQDLPGGRPVLAGPGPRRRQQPPGLVGHPQVHQGDARHGLSTRPTEPSTQVRSRRSTAT